MDLGSGPPHCQDHTSSPWLLASYHKLKCQAAVVIAGAWLASVDPGPRPHAPGPALQTQGPGLPQGTQTPRSSPCIQTPDLPTG